MMDIEMSDKLYPPVSPPKRISAPQYDIPRSSTQANTFAGPYHSSFTQKASGEILSLLKHVNCSYLSTKGTPPTLLQLKQHAHSLTVLIKNLSISTSNGLADNGNNRIASTPSFSHNEAFDWLNDLTKPYTNASSHHNKPLAALLNKLETSHQANSYQGKKICPLREIKHPLPNAPALPYASHSALLEHANDALEILDHEFTATGGLLSVLPPTHDENARKSADSTILGQMLSYMQRLVHRLRELEIEYANALDILANESIVPAQILARLGAEGRVGREVAYPQDRFVLANCGEDLWQYLNREFERKGRVDEQVRANWLKAGLEGEEIWGRRGGKEYVKGITYLDLTTRYFRLKGVEGMESKTVFVLPAWKVHPLVKETRRMEESPLVVVQPMGRVPERTSVWEMKRRVDVEELQKLKDELARQRKKEEELRDAHTRLVIAVKKRDEEIEGQAKRIREMEAVLENNPQDVQGHLLAEVGKLNAAKSELEKTRQEVKQMQEEVSKNAEAADRIKARQVAARNVEERQLTKERNAINEKLKMHNEESERGRRDAEAELNRLYWAMREKWQQQIAADQELLLWLRSGQVQERLKDLDIPLDIKEKAAEKAAEVVEDMKRPL